MTYRQSRPLRPWWKCWLCGTEAFCETDAKALHDLERHYAAKHMTKEKAA